MKNIGLFFAVLFLGVAILACANPVGAPANVETIVAMTFRALTAPAPEVNVTPHPSTNSLLPHSLYFLNNDKTGLMQVYRLAVDGKTLTQLTFEPAKVDSYDVSPIDGRIVYVSNNQLILINADGSGRRILTDGGTIAQNDYVNQVLKTIRSPIWSKDGQNIVYHNGGLAVYSLSANTSSTVLPAQFTQIDSSHSTLKEDYWPESFSPDGSKILINITFTENGTMGIYVPSTKQLYRLLRPDQGLVCCVTSWSPDGNWIFAASPTTGMIDSGLWRFDAATGNGTTLIGNPPSGNGPYVFADAPLVGADGQLYFFFNTLPDASSQHTPLKLVRSALDGVTGRTELRADVFQNINEILWSPDASFAIVAFAPVQDVYEGGQAEIVYPDGRPNVVLTSYAYLLKWGP